MHAAVLTAFLFACTGVCAAQASRLLGAGRANYWRLLIALIILAVWAHLFGTGFGGGVVHWFMLAGAVGFGVGGWCMFQALRRIGSTLSLLIVECAATFFASTIGWIWLGASLTTHEILSILMILTGVIVGITPGPIPDLRRRLVIFGCVLATIAALMQAISFNLSRHAFVTLAATGGTIDHLSAAYQRLVGGAGIAVLLYASTRVVMYCLTQHDRKPQHNADPGSSPLPAPVWVLLNAVLGPVLGVSTMLWAIRLVPNPGIVQAIAATATLITVPFAYYLEGARPRFTYYLGCLLALSGVAGLLLG